MTFIHAIHLKQPSTGIIFFFTFKFEQEAKTAWKHNCVVNDFNQWKPSPMAVF